MRNVKTPKVPKYEANYTLNFLIELNTETNLGKNLN